MNKFIFILIFCLPHLVFCQKDFVSNSFVSLDNENQFNIIVNQGVITSLDSIFKKDSIFIKRKTFVGLTPGFRYYQTNINEPTYFFNEVKFNLKTNPFNKFSTTFNPSLLISKKFTTFSYEFMSTYQYKKWYFEVSSERDLVGARALDVNLISNYYGLSVDYTIRKNLTLVSGYQYNYITDDNKRHFLVSRLIYSMNNQKVYFDLRTRDMRGGTWSQYYFSPETISQRQIGLGMNDSFMKEKIALGCYIGTGVQSIDNQNMYLLSFDFKIKTILLKKIKLESNLGFRNFNRYLYGFGNLKLKYTF